MKNDVGGKLISLEDRREKVWTVIVFKHFSKELMGFLSNAATVENLQFIQRKEELGIFKENEQRKSLVLIYALKDEEDMSHKNFTDSVREDWVSGLLILYQTKTSSMYSYLCISTKNNERMSNYMK